MPSQISANSNCNCSASAAASPRRTSQSTNSHWESFTALHISVSPSSRRTRAASVRQSSVHTLRRKIASWQSSATGYCTTLYQPSDRFLLDALTSLKDSSGRGLGNIQRFLSTCSSGAITPDWMYFERRSWGSRTRTAPAACSSRCRAEMSGARNLSCKYSSLEEATKYAAEPHSPPEAIERTSCAVGGAFSPPITRAHSGARTNTAFNLPPASACDKP
mmetsp:Transcript_142117/g.261779  ORF Transcript_142117/g.261779 Transcript_142117/m.261779 type:complete len:219 (+) Transcript_142117:823-1479(+)